MTTTTFPATGWYWHIHHDRLMGYCRSYAGRTEYLKGNKPPQEVIIRLRLMHPVIGRLPLELYKAKAKFDKAETEWIKSRAEHDNARAEWTKAKFDKAETEWITAKAKAKFDKAEAEWIKTEAEWIKAETELDKARAEHTAEIEALHKQECFRNCPWDGATIFPS